MISFERYVVTFLYDMKQAVIATVRKSGRGMLASVTVILMFHWLREKKLDPGDVWVSAIAISIYIALGVAIEYRRRASKEPNLGSDQ